LADNEAGRNFPAPFATLNFWVKREHLFVRGHGVPNAKMVCGNKPKATVFAGENSRPG